jgi:hypothetical protein
VEWVCYDSHVVSGQKSPGEKGSEMVHWRDGPDSSFIAIAWGRVFVYFHTVAVKFTIEFGIDRLTCQNEFFVNNPLDVKDK